MFFTKLLKKWFTRPRMPRPIRRTPRPGCRLALEQLEDRITPAGAIDLSALDGMNGFAVLGARTQDQVGRSLDIVGDVNGDGFDDVLIGADQAYRAPDGTQVGAAYVVFGKAGGFNSTLDLTTLDGSNGFRVRISDTGTAFARAVGAAGDLNGDGFADIVIGADNTNTNGPNSGAAYVLFGKASFSADMDVATLDGSNGFKLSGEAAQDVAGFRVGPAGDVNGDGFDDLLIAAPDNPAVNETGAVYVIFGKASGFAASLPLAALDGANGFKITGAAAFDRLGLSVQSAGDVDGDGFGDVILGAHYSDPNGDNSGAAYVIYGKAGGFAATLSVNALNGSNGFQIRGVAPGDGAGFSTSGAGDVNGDGFADLIIGAPTADPGGDLSGASYVVFGSAGGLGAIVELSGLDGGNGFKISGVGANTFSGFSVNAAGDVNGDGFDDVVIGASDTAPNGQDAETAYVVFGKASGFAANLKVSDIGGSNGLKLTELEGQVGDTREVRGGGDLNGDGFEDIIVGAFQNSTPGRDSSGEVYVFFGIDTGAVTHKGDTGTNTLGGTSGANVMVAGQANDILLSNGGADVLRGGQGDDLLAVSDLAFKRIVGGTGLDTLRLDGAGLSLNLTTTADVKITGIERIDITGSGANTLTLSKLEVLNLSTTSNTLTVLGDADDVVNIGAGWLRAGTEMIGGETFTIFTQGAATLKVGGPTQPLITIKNALTATYTDVDGDLVTVSVSKGRLGVSDFVLHPEGNVGGAQLMLVDFSDDGVEFSDANLTITATRTVRGGDGRGNVGFINATGVDLGIVTVRSDLGRIAAGDAIATTPGLDSLTVRSLGRLGTSTQQFGGTLTSRVVGKLSALNVKSDIDGASVNVTGPIGPVNVGGSLLGNALANSGSIIASGNIGTVAIGQDVRGGAGSLSGSVVAGGMIASLTLGGSLVGGSISAGTTLGPTMIGGDMDGGHIFTQKSLASLDVTGSVLNSRILAGYLLNGTPFFGDATIGAVTVNGDWVASDLVAGAMTSDPYFGNGGDSLIPGGGTVIAKITSIAIKGQAIGTPVPDNNADNFGFVAEQIGSFSVGGEGFPAEEWRVERSRRPGRRLDHRRQGARGEGDRAASGAALRRSSDRQRHPLAARAVLARRHKRLPAQRRVGVRRGRFPRPRGRRREWRWLRRRPHRRVEEQWSDRRRLRRLRPAGWFSRRPGFVGARRHERL